MATDINVVLVHCRATQGREGLLAPLEARTVIFSGVYADLELR